MKDGKSTTSSQNKHGKAVLCQWLSNLMATLPIPMGQTLDSLKTKLFLYVEALEDYSELCSATAMKEALLTFKTFPSPKELSDFFTKFRKSDPYWTPPEADFEPPAGYEEIFKAWEKSIGPAAYLAWLCGAKAWIRPDKSIYIEASSPFKARWIRREYVLSLENIAACPVSVASKDEECVNRAWPYSGPRTVAEAWYQANERWKGDTKTASDISIENMFQWSDE